MPKQSKTHSLIYYIPESGNYIVTTPRLWAHANLHHFTDPNPRDVAIENYLKTNFGFVEIPPNNRTVVLHHFAPNIPVGKNGKSFY